MTTTEELALTTWEEEVAGCPGGDCEHARGWRKLADVSQRAREAMRDGEPWTPPPAAELPAGLPEGEEPQVWVAPHTRVLFSDYLDRFGRP